MSIEKKIKQKNKIIPVTKKDIILISITEYNLYVLSTHNSNQYSDSIAENIRSRLHDKTKCIVIVPDKVDFFDIMNNTFIVNSNTQSSAFNTSYLKINRLFYVDCTMSNIFLV